MTDPWHQVRRGVDAALGDFSHGRDDLRASLTTFVVQGDPEGVLVSAAALVQFIGIADDDYAGFEDAAARVVQNASALDGIVDPDYRALAQTGLLVASWFRALDAPQVNALAEQITRRLGDALVSPAVRCCAAISVLACFDAQFDLERVLWLELQVRPLLRGGIGERLAGEWQHALLQALYMCGAGGRGEVARVSRSHAEGASAGGNATPVVALKRALLEAQMSIGEGRLRDGETALARAEPLLDPRAPRHASWWHLLQSRLHLTEGRHQQALTYARLALRLATDSAIPERWMGVTIMQEGQIHVASGEWAAAVPFFERAGGAASGSQADFCTCLAHFARGLSHCDADGRLESARAELAQGVGLAARLHWVNFFRPSPRAAAMVCAVALELGIEPDFVQEVIATRSLEAVRHDFGAWPWPVRVRTLGRFAVELEGRPLVFSGKVARKPIELLQFLIASGGTEVSAASAMFTLWRDLDGDKARSAFNVALHRLRKLLANNDAIQLELGRISLHPKAVWIDALAFEQLVDSALAPVPERLSDPAAASLHRAVGLYRGPFLGDDEDEPWQLVYRSRLASKFTRAVRQLTRHARANGDATQMRSLLERALEIDPSAEDTTRELMELLSDSGERASALAVFERCRLTMARLFDAQPASSTLELAERLRAAQ